jgi:hypothetical protein
LTVTKSDREALGETIVAAVQVGVGIANPLAGAAMTVLTPGVRAVMQRLNQQRTARVQKLLLLAAKLASTAEEEVQARLDAIPDGGKLLVETLLVAQDEGSPEKFLVLAMALGRASGEANAYSVTADRLIVAAIADLGGEHLEVLGGFVQGRFEQISEISSGDPVVDADTLIAGLERHGLLRRDVRTESAQVSLRGMVWSPTALGVALVERLAEASSLVAENRDELETETEPPG